MGILGIQDMRQLIPCKRSEALPIKWFGMDDMIVREDYMWEYSMIR